MRNISRGFTLIEVLFVVAIIAVLAIIAISQFASLRENAFNATTQSDMKNFQAVLEAEYAEKKKYPDIF